jgi:hypothetical protein
LGIGKKVSFVFLNVSEGSGITQKFLEFSRNFDNV